MKLPARVLIAGSCEETAMEQMYVRAFRKIGVPEVHLLNTDSRKASAPLLQSLASRLNSRRTKFLLQKKLLEFLRRQDSYELIIVFKGMAFPRDVLEEARRLTRGTLWVNINPDDPFNLSNRGSTNQNVLNSLSLYDIYCSWSPEICTRISASGKTFALRLPFGYDPEVHYRPPSQLVNPFASDISFIGSWDRTREAILEGLSGYNLKIYGNGWKGAWKARRLSSKISGCSIFNAEMRMAVAGSLLNLNLLRSQNLQSHNMRTFEIPAMGGMMLSTRSDEQRELFEEGKEAEYYGSSEELLSKAAFYLQRPDVCRRIAQAGHEKVIRSGHTYENRLKTLLKYISKAAF